MPDLTGSPGSPFRTRGNPGGLGRPSSDLHGSLRLSQVVTKRNLPSNIFDNNPLPINAIPLAIDRNRLSFGNSVKVNAYRTLGKILNRFG